MARSIRAKLKILTIMGLLLILTAGCGQVAKHELAFRSAFKKTWDAAMTASDKAQKNIETDYAAGDVAAVVAEYRILEKRFNDSVDETEKLKPPEGYVKLKKLTLTYYREGASYYRVVAKVVEDTGGNYGTAQEETLKAQEKKWQQVTESLEQELKRKRFELK
ncbi:MAG: hypothetical protein ABH838_00575 [Actinomycetota bacterium]